MADDLLSLLSATDLQGFNNYVQQSDPFGIAGRSLAQWTPNYSYMDATESGLTSFGKAFAQGLLQNYAQNNANQQLSSVIGVLPNLTKDPLSVVAPEGVDSGAFNLLRGSAYLNKMKKDAVLQESKNSTIADLLKAVGIEGIKSGTLDPKSALELVTTGALPESGTIDPLSNPNSPQYKVDKDQEAALSALRKEFNALDVVKNFSKASQGASALAGALKDKSKVSDQELVRYSILMIEPGMAVREGEQGAVANSQSIPDAWRGQLESALSGNSALGDDVREGIKRLATRAYNSHKGLYDQAYDLYGKEADFQGLDKGRLSYLGTPPAAESIFEIPGTEVPPQDVAIVNKLTLINQKAKSGTPLTAGERAFVEEIKKSRGK